jgi:Na+/melibiose symporter-like transporter
MSKPLLENSVAQPESSGNDKLSLKTKIAFGVGNAGEQVAAVTVSSYAMLYYNQVLGLPAYLAGLALSASLILDGLADPIAGGLSDRTRSKLGRRHVYMYLAPIPIALAFLALFNPPKGLSEGALFWWFLVSVGSLRAFVSFYETPHLALGGELSTHYTERSKIMGWNALVGWLGTAATTWIALTYFFKKTPEYPRGLLNPAPWGHYSMVMSVILLAAMFGSAWFTRDRVKLLPQPPKDLPPFSPFEFLKDMGKVLSNMNFVWILVGFFFTSLMIGLRNALHIYVNTFFWGLTSEQLRFFLLSSLFGIAVAFFVAPRLHGRFDKKWTMMVASVFYAIMPSIPVWMGMAGIMKPGDPYVLQVVIVFAALHAAVASISLMSVLSVLADIADENELKFGVRQEGALYAMRALFGKIDQAIGAAFAGFVLTLIAFPVKAKVGEIPPTVLKDLLLWDGIIAIIPGLASTFIYTQLKVNRASYEATKAALAARRGAEPPPIPLPEDPPDGGPMNEGGIPLVAR